VINTDDAAVYEGCKGAREGRMGKKRKQGSYGLLYYYPNIPLQEANEIKGMVG
jgi:hypothetical protein